MKTLLPLILILLSIIKVNAQQDVMTSQYMFNGLFLNPAYAGSHNYISSSLLHRSQWVNFEGAPRTAILAVDAPLLYQRMGVGLILSHDKIGVTSQTDIYANYSYFIKIGNGKLGLGLKGGVSYYSAQVSDLTVWDAEDVAFAGTTRTATLPKFGFGAYYFTKKWYAGISVPTLLAYDPDHEFNLSLTQSSAMRYHYYLTAGYVFTASDIIKVIPSFLVKYQPAAPVQIDLNFILMCKDMYSLGVAYRSNDAFSVMVQFQLSKRYRIGYAYDIITSKISNYSSGTHEIMLGFDFGKDIIKTKTPRFF